MQFGRMSVSRDRHRARSSTASLLGALVCAGLAASPSSAQVFQRLVGTQVHESVEAVRNSMDGGYFTAGDIGGNPVVTDFNVVRYRSDGSILWSTQYGLAEPDHAYSCIAVPDDTVTTAGRRQITFAPLGLALLRLNAAGNFVWAWNYRGDGVPFDAVNVGNIPSVAVRNTRTPSGERGFAVVTGIGPNGPFPNSQVGQLLVVNDAGAQAFNNAYFEGAAPNPGRLTFTDLRFDDTTQTYAVTGTIEHAVQPIPGGPFVTRRDILYVRINLGGAVIFARTYRLPAGPAGEVSSWGDGITLAANGDVLIAGHTEVFGGAAAPGTIVLRLNAAGAVIWTGLFKDFAPHFRSIEEAPDQTIGIVGTSALAGPAGGPLALLTLTAAGAPIFERSYAPLTGPDFGKSGVPKPAPECGWTLVGDKTLPAGIGMRDFVLVKTDQFGRSGCFENRLPVNRVSAQVIEGQIELLPIGMQEQTFWQAPLLHPTTIAPVLCLAPIACPGDANNDGTVNFADVTSVLANFGAVYPAGCLGPGDANGDGTVNFADITSVLANFGAVCP